MLDLLIMRALEATGKLCLTAPVVPTPRELHDFRRTDEFVSYMMDALMHIALDDGSAALTERKAEIMFFGKLLSYVLFQLQRQKLTWPQYYSLLLEDYD